VPEKIQKKVELVDDPDGFLEVEVHLVDTGVRTRERVRRGEFAQKGCTPWCGNFDTAKRNRSG
jgi:hypothetical protein